MTKTTHARGFDYDVTPGGHTACGRRVMGSRLILTRGSPTCEKCWLVWSRRGATFVVEVRVGPGLKAVERVFPLSWRERLIEHASVLGQEESG